jgi:hypothetical protein
LQCLSWHVRSASATVSDRGTLLESSELEAGAGDPGGNSRRVSDEDAMAKRGDGLSRRGEKNENVTSEANFDENVVITQAEGNVVVAANSRADSALDKREERLRRARKLESPESEILEA